MQEGETVGKAASGAAGSLAGSLLGGVIGQALIPVPGLGFIVGSTVGGLLGGFTGDRVYEGVSEVKRKQEEKLKEKTQDKSIVESSSLDTSIQQLNSIIKKFEIPVNKFQSFVKDIIDGKIMFGGARGEATSTAQTQQTPPPGEDMEPLEEMEATGGRAPEVSNSPFGWRWGRMHKGNDYAEPSGTPISIIQPGVVTVADMNYDPTGWGAVVQIRHKDGSSTLYAHLSKILVKEGQEVTPGTVIGNVGSTGRSTGSHLHFEYILPDGKTRVDPTKVAPSFFRFGGDVKVKPKPTTTPDLDLRSSETSQQSSSVTSQVPIESIVTATPIGTPETLMASNPDLNYNFPYNEENNETFIFLEQPEIAYLLGGGNQTPIPSSPQTNNSNMSFSTDLFTEQKAEEIALNRLLMASLS